ncbi:unannotated protein [freshwater metagenome]|uniref:Unannotated protein n=1 Tax=freshwater metagenome TaxID=449393 RepID=A0A6J6T1R0_9ZZZZ
MRLTLAPPLVLAANVQGAVRRCDARRRVGDCVPSGNLGRKDVKAHTAELGGGAGEVGINERLRQADGLEDLGPAIGGNRRDAHLRHDLEQTLAERLHEISHRLLRGGSPDRPPAGEVLDSFEGEVRVDRGRPVADEQRHVVHLAHVT